ncbi:MAG: DUF29 domain-containing protein [Acidobacteriia bacterium]|nr:DUF29 domain-containing protein [Terriglobia bacterium]
MKDAELYEQDFFLWTRETAAALRARRFADLDIDHIAEEIEDMGARHQRELDSRVTQILEHLLKLRLAKGLILEYNQAGWQASVFRQRREIAKILRYSPSLRRLATLDLIRECYKEAAAAVAIEYKVEPPADCPFSEEDILSAAT